MEPPGHKSFRHSSAKTIHAVRRGRGFLRLKNTKNMDHTASIFPYLNVSPLIAIYGTDYDKIEQWADKNRMWGKSVFISPSRTIENGRTARGRDILDYLRETILNGTGGASLIIARNSHFGLENDMVLIDALIEVYQQFRVNRRSVVFIGPRVKLHASIAHYVREFDWPCPEKEQISDLLARTVKAAHEKGRIKDPNKPGLVDNSALLSGLTCQQINEVMSVSYAMSQGACLIEPEAVARIREKKADNGLLTVVMPGEIADEPLLGFFGLKSAMERVLLNVRSKKTLYGRLPLKSSFLAYGYSGTGKSAFAWSFCREQGLPLVRLNLGRIRNENFGETEKRMEEALAAATRLAQDHEAVLFFLDEFEKLFSVSAADNSAHRATLAQLLEYVGRTRPDNLMVYATANRIDFLRQHSEEMLRRFHLYFSDLPDYAARLSLIRFFITRLTQGRFEADEESMDRLARQTVRAEPAALKTLILDLLADCNRDNTPLTSARLLEAAATKTIYRTFDPYAKEYKEHGVAGRV